MHSFIDAAEVETAWAALQSSEGNTDEGVIATRERLEACCYAMAHPETSELVPACVQHSILGPGENVTLRTLLPIAPTTRHQPGREVRAAHGCVMLDA